MRTDRTRACAHCALRFSSPDCPRCHGGEVYSIADKFFPAALERAGARDSPRATRAERLSWWLEWLARRNGTIIGTLVTLATMVLLPLAPSWTGKMRLSFALACTLLLIFLSAVLRTLLEMKRDSMIDDAHKKLRPLALAADPPIDPTLKRSTVRGKVRAPRPVTAPLSRVSCVAFRILGSAQSGPLDDGGGASFEVILEDGGAPVHVRVELGAATLHLERFGKRVRLRPQGKLADFLRPRALVGDGEIEVEEALLRHGDEVTIEGTCEEIAQGAGYRDTTTVRAFKEIPGSPLVIRG